MYVSFSMRPLHCIAPITPVPTVFQFKSYSLSNPRNYDCCTHARTAHRLSIWQDTDTQRRPLSNNTPFKQDCPTNMTDSIAQSGGNGMASSSSNFSPPPPLISPPESQWPAYFFPPLAQQRMVFCVELLKQQDVQSVGGAAERLLTGLTVRIQFIILTHTPLKPVIYTPDSWLTVAISIPHMATVARLM